MLARRLQFTARMTRDSHRVGVTLQGTRELAEVDVLDLCVRAFNRLTPGARVVAPATPLATPLVLQHDAALAVRLDHTTVWRAQQTVSEFVVELPHLSTTIEISIAYDGKQGFSVVDGDGVRFDAIAIGAQRLACEAALVGLLDVAYPWPYLLRGTWRYFC